jgi:hypothetical protein
MHFHGAPLKAPLFWIILGPPQDNYSDFQEPSESHRKLSRALFKPFRAFFQPQNYAGVKLSRRGRP